MYGDSCGVSHREDIRQWDSPLPYARPPSTLLLLDAFTPVSVTPGDWIVANEDGVVYVLVNMVYKVVEVTIKGWEGV